MRRFSVRAPFVKRAFCAKHPCVGGNFLKKQIFVYKTPVKMQGFLQLARLCEKKSFLYEGALRAERLLRERFARRKRILCSNNVAQKSEGFQKIASVKYSSTDVMDF